MAFNPEERAWAFTPSRVAEAVNFARASTVSRWVWRDASGNSPHLHLIVGRRSAAYYHRSREQGKEKLVRLGDATGPAGLALGEARERCNRIKFGAELTTVRKSKGKKVGITTSEVWESFLVEAAKGSFSLRSRGKRPLAPKTLKGYASSYRVHLEPRFGEKDLGVLLANVVAHIRAIAQERPATGNQVLAAATILIEFAKRRSLYLGPNPLKAEDADLRSFVPDHELELTKKQIKKLVQEVEAQPEYWSSFFKMLVLTASRLNNISQLKWSQVDFESKVITYQASSMKARKKVGDPITDDIQALLEKRLAEVGDSSAYVWPQKEDPSKPLRSPHHRWFKIRKAAGLPQVRVHDLKHLSISWADKAGVNARAVQAHGKHSDSRTTSKYSHLNPADQIPAVEAVAQVWREAQAPTSNSESKGL